MAELRASSLLVPQQLDLIQAYRRRLGLSENYQLPPTLATLQHLTELHLEHIPFENLSLHMIGEQDPPIVLDRRDLQKKILERRRGGCCLELNGLFSFLLIDLGYPVVRLVPCFVAAGPERGHTGKTKFRTVPSHFVILVWTQDGDRFMVDVGFGEPPLGPWPYHAERINASFVTPEGMESRMVWDRGWVDGSGQWRKCVILEWKQPNSTSETKWEPRLQWDVRDAPLDGSLPATNHNLSSFAYVIDLLVDPKSTFARKLIACSLTSKAKTSLSGRRLRTTTPRFLPVSTVDVSELNTSEDVERELSARFGIRLQPHERLDLEKSDSQCNSRLWNHL